MGNCGKSKSKSDITSFLGTGHAQQHNKKTIHTGVSNSSFMAGGNLTLGGGSSLSTTLLKTVAGSLLITTTLIIAVPLVRGKLKLGEIVSWAFPRRA
ncbi:MAG: hypothetical protein M1820_009754 [Bogoriella megaspora]|nr:MAG: hypothetical protein M1820_009754 [Bogoriella megaspora]